MLALTVLTWQALSLSMGPVRHVLRAVKPPHLPELAVGKAPRLRLLRVVEVAEDVIMIWGL